MRERAPVRRLRFADSGRHAVCTPLHMHTGNGKSKENLLLHSHSPHKRYLTSRHCKVTPLYWVRPAVFRLIVLGISGYCGFTSTTLQHCPLNCFKQTGETEKERERETATKESPPFLYMAIKKTTKSHRACFQNLSSFSSSSSLFQNSNSLSS